MLGYISYLPCKPEQTESGFGRRALLAGLLAFGAVPAWAQGKLDAAGATFSDFGIADNGASLGQAADQAGNAQDDKPARVLGIDQSGGFARVLFDAVKAEVGIPLGWTAREDWERGVATFAARGWRLLVWRIDFAFEGVRDAEHYAASKVGAIQARRPGVRGRARKLADGSFLIVFENVPPSSGDSGGRRTVLDLVVPAPGSGKEGILLTLGVPEAEGDRAVRLLALLKDSLKVH